MEVIDYFIRRQSMVLELFWEHMYLIVVAVGIAVAVGVILGIIITYNRTLAQGVLIVCQVLMTIPSIAMLGLLLPFFGIGFTTGMLALVLYSLLPIVRNTHSGIIEIDKAIIEAATGMGMNEWRKLTRIKLPLALPVIMAGIRTATVMVVGIGAIASYIGAGGLGQLIFNGISRTNPPMIITGAIFISIIAVGFDLILGWSERRLHVAGRD